MKINGLLLVNKPVSCTSHDVVHRVRHPAAALELQRRDPLGLIGGDLATDVNEGPTTADTLDAEKLRALRDVGVNRLSIGVQSFDPAVLAKFRADPFVAGFKGALDQKATTAELEHVATLIPDEWLAPATYGSADTCAKAVLRQLGRVKPAFTRLAMYNREARNRSRLPCAIRLDSELQALLAELDGAAAPLLRPLGIHLNIYPAKGYSATLRLKRPEAASVVSLLDDSRKIAISRLGDHIRIAHPKFRDELERTARSLRLLATH